MARKLKDYVFNGSGGAIYPWDKWLDGNVWELIHGEDFLVESKHFRVNLYVVAKKRGKKVRTNVINDNIIIQAYEA